MINSFSIYVACLASYNEGVSYGAWINAAQEASEISKEIQKMLRESPYNGKYTTEDIAEEWAIHDKLGFDEIQIGEQEDLEKISRIGLSLESASEFNNENAYRKFVELALNDDYSYEEFEIRYLGEFESEEDYGIQLAETDDMWSKCERIGLDPDLVDWAGYAQESLVNRTAQMSVNGGQAFYVFSAI